MGDEGVGLAAVPNAVAVFALEVVVAVGGVGEEGSEGTAVGQTGVCQQPHHFPFHSPLPPALLGPLVAQNKASASQQIKHHAAEGEEGWGKVHRDWRLAIGDCCSTSVNL